MRLAKVKQTFNGHSNHSAFYYIGQLVRASAAPLVMRMHTLSKGLAYVR